MIAQPMSKRLRHPRAAVPAPLTIALDELQSVHDHQRTGFVYG